MVRPLRHPWLRLMLVGVNGCALLIVVVLWGLSYGTFSKHLPINAVMGLWQVAYDHHASMLLDYDFAGPYAVPPFGLSYPVQRTSRPTAWGMVLYHGQFSFGKARAMGSDALFTNVFQTGDGNGIGAVSHGYSDTLFYLGPYHVEPGVRNGFGFHFSYGDAYSYHPGSPPIAKRLMLVVPLWFPTLVLGFSTFWLGRRLPRDLWRRWRGKGRGMCGTCGYDLRAHRPGQRCPECGTEIAGKGVGVG